MRRSLLRHRLVFVGQLDEGVFQAGGEWPHVVDADCISGKLCTKAFEVEAFIDQRVDRLAKNRGAANSGNLPSNAQRTRNLMRDDFNALRAGRLHIRQVAQRIRRAVGNELAEIDVSDVIAALSFVHVMGGYKKRDALRRKLEEQVPKLAARDRVDAGGGLIEKQQLR